MCISYRFDYSRWRYLLSSQQLVPESESEQREAQANLTEAAQDPNQSSEEPKADYAQEGKPRSITY
jgi:uncharacterized membrane-anchored protein YhcB (DUF1043 family)